MGSEKAGGNYDLVQFSYRNHRGEVGTRRVRPIRIWFGSTAWHPEAQWLLEAFDLDRQGTRDFALSSVLTPWTVYRRDADVEERSPAD